MWDSYTAVQLCSTCEQHLSLPKIMDNMQNRAVAKVISVIDKSLVVIYRMSTTLLSPAQCSFPSKSHNHLSNKRVEKYCKGNSQSVLTLQTSVQHLLRHHIHVKDTIYFTLP